MLTLLQFLQKELYPRGVKVIAGSGGLEKEVRAVTIVDTQDAYSLLKGKEILLSSGYIFHGKHAPYIDFLLQLVERQVSCLCIQSKRYFDEFPIEFINLAKDMNFPILELPEKIDWTEIIESFYRCLFEDQQAGIYSEQDFIDKLLKGNGNYFMLNDTALSLGLEPDGYNVVLILPLLDIKTLQRFQSHLRQVLDSLSNKERKLSFATYHKDRTILLLNFKSSKKVSIFNRQLLFRIVNKLSSQFNKLAIGVGSLHQGLLGPRFSYEESLNALRIGSILDKHANIYLYDEYLHFMFYDGCGKEDVKKFFQLNIARLIEIDEDGIKLVETLDAFLRSPTFKKAAALLYIHENTLRYRIQKISQIMILKFGLNSG